MLVLLVKSTIFFPSSMLLWGKKTLICIHSLLDMPLFSFNHGGNLYYPNIYVWRLGDEESAELALVFFGDVRRGYPLAVPRCSARYSMTPRYSSPTSDCWPSSATSLCPLNDDKVPSICLCTVLASNAYGSWSTMERCYPVHPVMEVGSRLPCASCIQLWE